MSERFTPTSLQFVRTKAAQKTPLSLSVELTARCNNDCRHCYINLPAGDREAMAKELTFAEWERIADMAKEAGVLWCLISGGEPMLRPDFFDLYLMFKKKGFLITLFTNGTLLTEEAVAFLKKYPPYKVEVSVYGVTEETYVAVTGKKGYCAKMKEGIERLLQAGIYTCLKTPLIRSNQHEADAIYEYCSTRTREPFRFDTALHQRMDFDEERNRLICEERLTDRQVLDLEGLRPERIEKLKEACSDPKRKIFIDPETGKQPLFRCRAGSESITVDAYGRLRLCVMLSAPQFLYDLKNGTIEEAMGSFRERILSLPNENPKFEKCKTCRALPLCNWCPGRALLACGQADAFMPEVCRVAEKRYDALMKGEA
ncbi:MAG: radical SAM protein [Clostridia bacterium]|nr:radical SAM protein [Clostridia bacterium]